MYGQTHTYRCWLQCSTWKSICAFLRVPKVFWCFCLRFQCWVTPAPTGNTHHHHLLHSLNEWPWCMTNAVCSRSWGEDKLWRHLIFSMLRRPGGREGSPNIWNKHFPSLHLLKFNAHITGPFWVCTTLVFTTAIAGNLANYIQHGGNDYEWRYDFHKGMLRRCHSLSLQPPDFRRNLPLLLEFRASQLVAVMTSRCRKFQ